MVPLSTVIVGFQGASIAILPVAFYSSETVGIEVTFVAAGDYTFTMVAPDGSQSLPLTLTVAPSTTPLFSVNPPAITGVWPPAFDTTFVGNVWIMGTGFLPGAMLVGTGPTGPIAAPLLFVNERTLGWVTATPLAGSYTLQVMNPTFAQSSSVTVTVGQPTVPLGALQAPSLVYAQQSVASPFVGTVRIFGKNFLPGAVVEMTDANGYTVNTPLIFVASDEVWWMLVYPTSGTYTVLVRNPDGQATPTWSFVVQ
jgi:hypothetical protein